MRCARSRLRFFWLRCFASISIFARTSPRHFAGRRSVDSRAITRAGRRPVGTHCSTHTVTRTSARGWLSDIYVLPLLRSRTSPPRCSLARRERGCSRATSEWSSANSTTNHRHARST
ncbi:hypothetical protein PUN28_019470 [Cardiocondyla obscurior]|uniref:Secreted protein n=1 Tax=Cardiocondyla obscurior TaxID=286306 RepID=A0AAW2ECP0_9HYME